MSRLVHLLIKGGYLKSDLIIDAFSEISRIEFVPEDFESQADANVALPIGYGQTISQPLTVAIMMDLLDPKAGQNILDVGSGSGWTTALLCYIVGKKGRVTAIERIEALRKIGEKNVAKYGYGKGKNKEIVAFYHGDGSEGFKKYAPYDRVLVSAAVQFIPEALKAQLKIGGKMVIPVRNSLTYLEKKEEGKFYKEEFPGFVFVPMIEGAGI
jgi:protein-L-isoaspartate(D-aspartate) O-methyltransferase